MCVKERKGVVSSWRADTLIFVCCGMTGVRCASSQAESRAVTCAVASMQMTGLRYLKAHNVCWDMTRSGNEHYIEAGRPFDF